MTTGKTKRQLRAEAVERLREMAEDPTMGSVAVAALGKPANGWEWRDALIDLLTDEELPEGDPARIMREAARGRTDDGKIIYRTAVECARKLLVDGGARECVLSYDAGVFFVLADMVERDYVRREDYEDAAELCGRYADRIAELEAGHGPRENNLTWLYNYDEAFAEGVDYACKYVSGLGADCGNEREWLMSEHGAEVVLNAEKYDLEPESGGVSHTGGADVKGKPAAQAPEQGFVTERQLEPDTREELEADVRRVPGALGDKMTLLAARHVLAHEPLDVPGRVVLGAYVLVQVHLVRGEAHGHLLHLLAAVLGVRALLGIAHRHGSSFRVAREGGTMGAGLEATPSPVARGGFQVYLRTWRRTVNRSTHLPKVISTMTRIVASFPLSRQGAHSP